jgi:hypothetical protein
MQRHSKQINTTQGWRVIGGQRIFFRSQWEYRYAVYLESLKQRGLLADWKHEPKTFLFEKIRRGTVSYKPDFQVFDKDGSHHWVEVKGYYDSKSLTKISRFRKYFPEETLRVIDSRWFRKNARAMKILEQNCRG